MILEILALTALGLVAGVLIIGFFKLVQWREPAYSTTITSYMSLDEFLDEDLQQRWTGYILFRSLPLLLILSLTAGVVQTLSSSPYPWLVLPLAIAWLVSSIGQIRVTLRRSTASNKRVASGIVVGGTLLILIAISVAARWVDFSWLVPTPEGLVDNLWAALFAAVLVILYLNVTAVTRSEPALQVQPLDNDASLEPNFSHETEYVPYDKLAPHKIAPMNEMVRKRAQRIETDFGPLIRETASLHGLDSDLMSAVIIYEDMNRPSVLRRLENMLVTCLPLSMTVGIAQVWSSKRLSDRASIERMGQILADLSDEANANLLAGDEYYWFVLERYNHSREYARNVLTILEQIRS